MPKTTDNVVVLWHDGNFARRVASNLGEVTLYVANNRESYEKMLAICKKHATMTEKDVTPKLPAGHPLNEWLEES